MFWILTPRTSCVSALPSRSVSVDESRPEFICRLDIGVFSVSVLHIDPLSPAETSPNVNPLTPMAVTFFSCIEKMDPTRLSTEDFKFFRAVFAEACSHDHLRWTLLIANDTSERVNAYFGFCPPSCFGFQWITSEIYCSTTSTASLFALCSVGTI